MLFKINQFIYLYRITRKYKYSHYKRQKLIYNVNNIFFLNSCNIYENIQINLKKGGRKL